MVYKILDKRDISPGVMRLIVYAPEVARQARPGQFVILRVHKDGERIPMSIPDLDPDKGTITLVVQEVGKSTAMLYDLNARDDLADVEGPMGKPTHIENFGNVVAIGGGVGIAPLYPITRALKRAGNYVTSILGGRSREFVIMQREMWSVSDEATQELMIGFYTKLLAGKSKRDAFREAQLELKEKYPGLYYWGAFVMVGQ